MGVDVHSISSGTTSHGNFMMHFISNIYIRISTVECTMVWGSV